MRLEKVSFDEWKAACIHLIGEDIPEEDLLASYDAITLPKSSTAQSAGHDFFMPFSAIELVPEYSTLIPTGVRWVTEPGEENTVMLICPRSSLGIKYGMRLSNTVGVIDSDYYKGVNEGHIMACIEVKDNLIIERGQKFIQGIILNYINCGEKSTAERSGGFGSTGE